MSLPPDSPPGFVLFSNILSNDGTLKVCVIVSGGMLHAWFCPVMGRRYGTRLHDLELHVGRHTTVSIQNNNHNSHSTS